MLLAYLRILPELAKFERYQRRAISRHWKAFYKYAASEE
jgi:hypothetical protein